MTEAPQYGETSLLDVLGKKYNVSPQNMLATIKATIFQGKSVSNEAMMAFLMVANQYDLNPFLREIFAFPSKGGIIPIVSIDGWIKLVLRHSQYGTVSR
jgi:hypothetical protein